MKSRLMPTPANRTRNSSSASLEALAAPTVPENTFHASCSSTSRSITLEASAHATQQAMDSSLFESSNGLQAASIEYDPGVPFNWPQSPSPSCVPSASVLSGSQRFGGSSGPIPDFSSMIQGASSYLMSSSGTSMTKPTVHLSPHDSLKVLDPDTSSRLPAPTVKGKATNRVTYEANGDNIGRPPILSVLESAHAERRPVVIISDRQSGLIPANTRSPWAYAYLGLFLVEAIEARYGCALLVCSADADFRCYRSARSR
jgi:hypothetical protein